jgi:acetylserotonin N-methyltransferase
VAQDFTPADPTPVLDLLNAFRKSQVMLTAVEMQIFDHLHSGPLTVDELARTLPANADALERLLGACVMLGLLLHTPDGKFANTPTATTYLTSQSPNRFTGYINYTNAVLWQMWDYLPDAIREGTHRWKQTFGFDGPIFSHFFRTEEAKREFLFGMHGYGLLSSPEVVSALDLSRFGTFVDLGGATGHLTIAACQRYSHMRGIVTDLPQVVPITKEVVSGSNVSDRIAIVAGDFFTDPLPAGDLYAVGRILHDWTEEKIRILLKKVYAALPENGGFLIAEKLLQEDKAGPEWAVLQSLNMLICTEGKERSLSEYERLLNEAGFREVLARRTTSPLDVVLAIK